MKLTENSKVYILCPANAYTGGPTLLHQLGARLRADGIEAYMYYWPVGSEEKIHPGYKKYALPLTDHVEDRSENVLIIPETLCGFVPQGMKIQRVLWWLSVDNWWRVARDSLAYYEKRGDAFTVQPLPNVWAIGDAGLIHWVQSEYAKRFLLCNGVPAEKILPVGDYLDEVFLERNKIVQKEKRQDIVAFNPKKGWEFTRKLIEHSMDLAWRPVQDMTPEQVEEFLHTAKVYVDFGNHPGKDRIPREAVMAGCCLITGKRGAAANEVDIPIEGDLKFEDTEENIPRIVAKIRELLANYEQEADRYAAYRQKIMQEPAAFRRQVRAAMGLETSREETELILSHGLGGGTEVFLQEYLQQESAAKQIVMRPGQAPRSFAEWQTFVQHHHITKITVNHLLGFSLFETMASIRNLGIPYTFYVHDYLCICPNWSLDCQAAYCQNYRSQPYCQKIFQELSLSDFDLKFFRQKVQEFLTGAAAVIAPSAYAAQVVNQFYPQVKITSRPHKLQRNIARSFQPQFAHTPELTLTFLGSLCAQKGARYILQLNSWLKRRNLPVRLVVMGEDIRDIDGDREGIIFTGKYDCEKVSGLLAQHQTAVVLIPSAFPETYCYTASEAILSGYPVVTMNLGAQALRVQRADCGWVLERNTPDRGQLALQRLVRRLLTPSGRQDILQKAANTKNFRNGME